MHYNKVCYVQNFAANWYALDKWRFEEGQEYLQGKLKDKVDVYLNLEDAATMREDYQAGLDNFKPSYLKRQDYDTFVSRLQNNKYGVVMRDRDVYKAVKEDVNLPDFLEQFASRQFVEVIQGRQFTMSS